MEDKIAGAVYKTGEGGNLILDLSATIEKILSLIEENRGFKNFSDRVSFEKTFQLLDGRNVQLGKTTGTKIGTETTQKLGFFAKTPVVQQSAPNALVETGADSDGTARAAVNTLRTALINLGLIA